MSSDDNVNSPAFKSSLDVREFLGSTHPADILYVTRKILQTGLESIVMLERKNGSRHKHRHLLAVRNGLESSPYGKFSLAETHIAAHEPVHRTLVLHISLDSLCGRFLVRSIFIHETRFQFLLKISVGGVREAVGCLSFRIKIDKFLGNILYLRLGIGLERLPRLGAEFVDFRRHGILGLVPRNLVQCMYGYEHYVIVLVHQLHDLMDPALVIFHADKTAEHADAVVDVHNIITDIERIEVVQCQLLAFLDGSPDAYPMEPVENLMIRIAAEFVFIVNESLMDILLRNELRHDALVLVQYGPEALYLRLFLGVDEYLVSALHAAADVG